MREGVFAGKDGIDLYYQAWEAEPASQPAKASIIVVHGFGENCNRWRNVLDHFPSQGYAVYIYDQRGHGRSPGQRGYINNWSEYREDLRKFVALVADHEPGLKRFIYALSMGGAVALDYGLQYPQTVSGVICSAPGIGQFGISKLLIPAAWIVNFLYPRLTMENPIDPYLVSRDRERVKFMLSDPLSHGKGTARWFWELRKTGKRVRESASEWQLPLLLLHGTADAYASIEGSREFYSKLTCKDVAFIEYEGAYHELHNDIVQDQVFSDIERWLGEHI